MNQRSGSICQKPVKLVKENPRNAETASITPLSQKSPQWPEGIKKRKRASPGEFVECSVYGCSKKSYCQTLCSLHYGRLRLIGRLEPRPWQERFWDKVKKGEIDECWEWQHAFRRDGYGVMTLHRKVVAAHRISWMITHGEIPDGKWVLHKCDNKKCVNPNHLFLGYSKDNVHDMIAKGRQAIGSMFRHSKLTEEKVRQIKASTKSNIATARQFGVSRQLVDNIKAGKRWKHIK